MADGVTNHLTDRQSPFAEWGITDLEIDFSGPLAVHASLQDRIVAWTEALFATIDKRDGAVLAGDGEWIAKQFLAAADFANQSVLDQFRLTTLNSLLVPYFNKGLGTAEERLVILQTYGLSGEVASHLRSLGYTESVISVIDQELRQATLEDIERLDASAVLATDYVGLGRAAVDSYTLLRRQSIVKSPNWTESSARSLQRKSNS